jgi:23S rRNA pseudouridine1911/1915/1917 synthase
MSDELKHDLQRLARVVQKLLGSSHSRAKREIELGRVKVAGEIATDPGLLIGPSQSVSHDPHAPSRPRFALLSGPRVEVVHTDTDIVVVEKPAGLLVHPTREGEKDTLLLRAVDALQRRTGSRQRLLIVHRIDRDTSGLLVLARSSAAVKALQQQFREHTISRRYLAFVSGDLKAEVSVDRAIGRPRPGARRAAISSHHAGSRDALTRIRPVERFGKATLVEATLGTGRTHQVRVHLAWLGHPVLGDSLYGDPQHDPAAAPRLALHAAHLGFRHPGTGKEMEFDSPLPRDLQALWAGFRHGGHRGKRE